MGQTATLKKISAQLNLSISTVSRALKNHPDISENTKRKVRELAALMEYEPNSYAVNLRTNKSKVIGLIVPDISNTFNDSFIAAAETAARKAGYSVLILQSANDTQQEADNLRLCRHYRVDGILISQCSESIATGLAEKYNDAGIPVVFFDRVPDSGVFDTVCMADEEAATIAAHTITTYRKKNILALFGIPALSISRKRKETFLKILKDKPGIEVRTADCADSRQATLEVSRALEEKQRPDHIFCMSDELLIGTMKALHATNLRIPEDITVLAISNGLIPDLFKPTISYIETSGYELGKLAMQRMLENLENKTAPRTILLPARLVEGGSLR